MCKSLAEGFGRYAFAKYQKNHPRPGRAPQVPAVQAPVAGDLAFQRNQTMRRSLFEGVGG